MKKFILLLPAVLVSFVGFAQRVQPADSRITDVTVFLQKAQVSRIASAHVEAGKTNLLITGLPGALDEKSIQVSGSGAIVILGIRHQQNFLTEHNTPAGLAMIKDSISWYQRHMSVEKSQREILDREEQLLLANQKIGGNSQNLTVTELKAMADFFRARMGELVVARMKSDDKMRNMQLKTTRLQRQLNEQNDRFSQNTSEIVVSVSAAKATDVKLEVRYVVANAGWIPMYDLRATNVKSALQLNYKANVFQQTGESWDQVRLKLSTANPDEDGRKPELTPWYVNFYYPAVYGYMSGKAAGVAVESEFDDREYKSDSLIAETVARFTTTIQTTLNTEFDIALPYNVPSAAQAVAVDIQTYEMNASYQYAAAPKLDRNAFLMAHATGWEAFSLLPGEANLFFDGTFIGKSFIDPASLRDTLTVSMGRDKRIIIDRTLLKELSTRRAIGANQRDSYVYEIAVRNTRTETITIMIEDQIPVTQHNQIEVITGKMDGARYNALTGKLEWTITLAPNETRKLNYAFDLKYPKGKQINGV